MAKTKTIAVFDTDMRLVGSKRVALTADGIDPGDLPLNGTYKWYDDRKTFVPLGHGFGKIKMRAPHSTEYVLARMIETAGDAAPIEARNWLNWYNANMRIRDEELSVLRSR